MLSTATTARDVENARELYDRYRFGKSCYDAQREQHNIPLVEFLASVDNGATVYDIGCGAGYWLERAVRLGVPKGRMHGVDLSPTNVGQLQVRGFNASWGNVLDLDLDSDVSDYTVCNGVIHHTPDPFRAFQELVRITRPGGYIFLSVYNRWHPYFYIVHRASWPIRYLYWHWSKRILGCVYPIAQLFFQPLAYLVLGTFLDEKSGKMMLADQVLTPHAHLFFKAAIRRYARKCNCELLRFRYVKGHLLLTAVLKVSKHYGDWPAHDRSRPCPP